MRETQEISTRAKEGGEKNLIYNGEIVHIEDTV